MLRAANDISAIFWNPAALSFIPVREIQVSLDMLSNTSNTDFLVVKRIQMFAGYTLQTSDIIGGPYQPRRAYVCGRVSKPVCFLMTIRHFMEIISIPAIIQFNLIKIIVPMVI